MAGTPNRLHTGLAQWWPTRTCTPSESSTCPTSCGCTSPSANEMVPPRPTGTVGPKIRRPGTVARASSAYAVSSFSCHWMAGMPIAVR